MDPGGVDLVDLTYAIVGVGALLAALLPRLLANRSLSMPIVFLAIGTAVYALVHDLPDPDRVRHPGIAERLAEVSVMVALMGAEARPADRQARAWSSTWRLLAIAMPLTIAATAFLGWWWVGLAPAAALLLGSALAPTDPVLASDVQVGKPGGAEDEEDEEDEVRFALTSEAGLNDALAFPFVHAAIAMVTIGADPAGWLGGWALDDVAFKIAVGVVGGVVTGRLLALLFFRSRRESLRLAAHAEGFVALAATFLAYGVTEVAGGYGFLAVFVCARSIRASERTHEYHQVLHHFVEQIERLLLVLLLVLLGGAIVRGLLEPLTWAMVGLAVALVVVVRPAAALLSLYRGAGSPGQKRAIAAFGIRGIGTFYYLAYATAEAGFAEARALWPAAGFTVVLWVVVHAVAATPIMRRLDRRLRAAAEDRDDRDGADEPDAPGRSAA